MGDRFGAVSDVLIPDMRQATHVWLPITLDAKRHTMQVKWTDQWDPAAL
jgi:hypothetical protein